MERFILGKNNIIIMNSSEKEYEKYIKKLRKYNDKLIEN